MELNMKLYEKTNFSNVFQKLQLQTTNKEAILVQQCD